MVGVALLTLARCRSVASTSVLRASLLVIAYFTVGIVFYKIADEKACESEELLEAIDYDAETCTEPWTVIDSLYFSVVTMSTVGYGDFSPSNDGAKVFTVLYIIIGITVVWVQVLSVLGEKIEQLREKFQDGVDEMHGSAQVHELAVATEPEGACKFWFKGLGFGLFCISVLQLIFAAIFTALEPEVGYGDALYHCLVTATTVGYGDVSLTTQRVRLAASAHIVISVSWLAIFIANIDSLRSLRRVQLKSAEILNKPLDTEKIRKLDRGGDNTVDKLEFVVGMLMALGAEFGEDPLEWKHVEPFVQRFDQMDRDKSGNLGVKDLIQGIQNHQDECISKAKRRIPAQAAVAPEPQG